MALDQKAAQIRLRTLLQSTAGALPVDWQNMDFTPTAGTAYLRERFAIVDEQPISLIPIRVRATALYLLDYFAPANTDELTAKQALRAFLLAFSSPQTLVDGAGQSLRLRRTTTKLPVVSTLWEQYPIEIKFVADTLNP